jgi:hypothetical protein
MSEREPGESLRDKISSEHRKLEEIFEDLRAALRSRDVAGDAGQTASEVLEEMREEVEAQSARLPSTRCWGAIPTS